MECWENMRKGTRDLQAFQVFSQPPKWVYNAGKLMENVSYCFNEVTMKRISKERTLLCQSSSLFSLYFHSSDDVRKPIKVDVRMNELNLLLLTKRKWGKVLAL